MQTPPSLDFTGPEPEKAGMTKFVAMLQKSWKNLTTVINGNLGFGDGTNSDNLKGIWKSVNFPTANTDVTVTHNLGSIPVGYVVMQKSAAGDVYTGSIAATKTQITLRCSVAGVTASLFIV